MALPYQKALGPNRQSQERMDVVSERELEALGYFSLDGSQHMSKPLLISSLKK